jgi:hypothetical protein
VIIIVFQSVFCLEIYQDNIFLALALNLEKIAKTSYLLCKVHNHENIEKHRKTKKLQMKSTSQSVLKLKDW